MMPEGYQHRGHCCSNCFHRREQLEQQRKARVAAQLRNEATMRQQQEIRLAQLQAQLRQVEAGRQQSVTQLSQERNITRTLLAEKEETRRREEQMTGVAHDLMQVGFRELEARMALAECDNSYEQALAMLNRRQQTLQASPPGEQRVVPMFKLEDCDFQTALNPSQTVWTVRLPGQEALSVVRKVDVEQPDDNPVQRRVAAVSALSSELGLDNIPHLVTVLGLCLRPGSTYGI